MEQKQPANNYYLPAATPLQILSFRRLKPETHTSSRFLNHFLDLFARGFRSEKELIREMNLKPTTFYELMRAEAGMSFRSFTDYKRAYDIHILLQEMRQEDKRKREIVQESIDFEKLEENLSRKHYLNFCREIKLELGEHMEDDYENLAQQVGFADRSSLWYFVHSKRYHAIVAELGLTPLVIKSSRRNWN